MRKYITKTENTCWRDCLGCILEINPSKIPNFVKEYKNDYMEETRIWLKDKYGKGLVYVPIREFMESNSDKLHFNSSIAPVGYSIGYMSLVDKKSSHVIICKDGMVEWDNGDDRHDEYDVLKGYFIIYDLEIKGVKKTVVKKRKRK
jgi:hypothetical protein